MGPKIYMDVKIVSRVSRDRKDMREKNIGVHDETQNLCGCENRQSSQSSRMHDLFNDYSSDGTEPDSEAQAPSWRVGSSALELRQPGENDSPGRTLPVPSRHGDEPKLRPTVTAGLVRKSALHCQNLKRLTGILCGVCFSF